ncbi:MAG: hypothetical protein COB71_06250 [Thiotrichales bacterium]|nr:MAG: hypothetical protein COB71_12360 [Thiotrichales bacterium]PCI13368.1 MAG: hypothetical protein COB71_06250 [Thiotrichales bacterium]
MNVLCHPIFDLLKRAGLLAVLWWIVTGGVSESWLIGLPVVFIAAYLSLLLKPAQTPRVYLIPLLRFIPYFSVCIDLRWH